MKSDTVYVGGVAYRPSTFRQDLARLLELARVPQQVSRGDTVFVKPNYTLPYPKPGVTTHAEVLEPLLAWLKNRAGRVLVGEGDGGYGSFTAEYSLKNHGIEGICRRTGAEAINLSKAEPKVVEGTFGRRTYRVPLPKILTQVDRSLSVPVLKTHVVVVASLGIKNLWGCHPSTLRILDHDHLSEKLALIARTIQLGPVVIDGLVGQDRRGPIEGDPVSVGAVLAGNNPVATDACGVRLMGLDPRRVRHIVHAEKVGLGPLDVQPGHMVGDDLRGFQQRFRVRPTLVDRLGASTFRSRRLTKIVFDSWASPIIYRLLGRRRMQQIRAPEATATR